MIRYIDLFAGIGGFHYGIHKAIGEMGSCVYANEWDQYANSVYRNHYGDCDLSDIKLVRAYDVPDHDLLCAGFPCQSFSVAGKRGGFDDTRGTLFFEIARIAAKKQPRLLLLENVKGLLNHDQGRTFRTILAALDELGYDAQWQVLNSKDWGVPQNRERVFIVGHLRGGRRPEVFPLRQSHPINHDQELQQAETFQTGTLNAKNNSPAWQFDSGTTLIELTKDVSDAQRIYDSNGIAKTLKGLGGGMGAKTGLYAIRHPLKFLQRNQRNIDGDYAFTVDGANTGGVKIINPKMRNFEGSDTESVAITASSYKEPPVVMPQIRRLTPVECERLQGFPDDWTKYDANGKLVSDTQRYKMCGNAVTTNVVTAIAKQLFGSEVT